MHWAYNIAKQSKIVKKISFLSTFKVHVNHVMELQGSVIILAYPNLHIDWCIELLCMRTLMDFKDVQNSKMVAISCLLI